MNFDSIDTNRLRRGHGAKWSGCAPDVLPAWVADMDFPVARPITDALAEMVERADFGYPVGPPLDGLPAIFAQRAKDRFDWHVDPDCVEVLNDVVQGIHLAIEMFSAPGDGVITPLPIYPPFLAAVHATRRTPVWQNFALTAEGFEVDIERLREELPDNVRMLLVCNPHNPTGHVLAVRELEALAEIAIERDLIVVSDEIHADLVYSEFRHTPMAMFGSGIAERTITLTSATKAFNIAGLRCAVAVFGTPELRRRFNTFHPHARGGLGTPGLVATAAAWSRCQLWQDEVLHYLEGNRDFLCEHARSRWPGVVLAKPQATYLAWMDFRALLLEPSPQAFFLEKARVHLSDGEDFGPPGRGFVRLNFATSRTILTEILARMDAALGK